MEGLPHMMDQAKGFPPSSRPSQTVLFQLLPTGARIFGRQPLRVGCSLFRRVAALTCGSRDCLPSLEMVFKNFRRCAEGTGKPNGMGLGGAMR